MNNPTRHSTNDQSFLKAYSRLLLFSLFCYCETESLNDAISAIKSNSDDEELAGCLGLDMKVLSVLNDSLSRSAKSKLEINMSHHNLIFHHNPHELTINEVSEIVTKKCKGLVDNLISKEVFERFQSEAVLRFANQDDQIKVMNYSAI